MRRALLLLIAPLLLTACGSGSETTGEPVAGKAQATKADASTTFACRHFRNVIGDLDVLSDAELREKIKEVETDANVSENANIREHGRAMLAALTANDAGAFMEDAKAFAQVCSELGV
jgi:hypothetical protein